MELNCDIFHFTRSGVYGGDLDDYPDYYDITFLFSGTLHYAVDGQAFELSSGNAVCISPHSHRVRIAQNQDFSVEYVSFNFKPATDLTLPLWIDNCLNSEVRQLIFLFEGAYFSHLQYKKEKQILLLQTLIYTLDEIVSVSKLSPHAVEILKYIDEHLSEKITLSGIAGSVFLTPAYCSSLIKKELGTNIFDIVIQHRIEIAQRYIFEKKHSLTEIALLCGYNDYSYFSKHFKRVTGYLPSELSEHKHTKRPAQTEVA